jgi:hypothetical protein
VPPCGIGVKCDALIPYRETGPWTASCDRFAAQTQLPPKRGESVSLDAGDPDMFGQDSADWCLPTEPAKPKLRFLIVTLPDPITTHLALYFDRTIEAVEAASQRDGFYLDRYWLPWSLAGATPLGGDTSQDSRVNRILDSFRLKQPGVMIFTGPADDAVPHSSTSARNPQTVMYVFLVSESPTSGINVSQFKNAVTYAKVLSNPTIPQMPVVGPFFSGSARSTIDLISHLPIASERLNFVSGTMTGKDEADTLRSGQILFHQTLHDDAVARDFFFCFLKDRHLTVDGSNVAILQEDETQYGSSLTEDAGQQTPISCRSDANKSIGFPGVRYIAFPRELWRLRNASPDTFGAAPAAPGQPTPNPSQELSWNWKDTSKGEDRVPSFSGQQEPLSQQAVMLSISDTIRKENINYVGIAATDIFDILFLSKLLKISAPNTRLFVLDADLLMVRTSSEGKELNGTLAVTTYPLFAGNSNWTGPGARSQNFRSLSVDTFPSRLAQGVYTAVLLQLDQVNPVAERKDADPLSNPERNESPELWLTMVGRTEFWPVALKAHLYRETASTPRLPVSLAGAAQEPLTFDPPDGTTLFLQSVLFAWGLIHMLAIWLARRNKWIEWLGQLQVSSTSGQGKHAQYHAYYLSCATLALSAMLLLIAVSFLRLLWDGGIESRYAPLFYLAYLGIGLVGAALVAGVRWIAPRKVSKAVGPAAYWIPWIVYCATVIIWTFLNVAGDGDGVFFAQRAFFLSNGLSPLLPVELLLLMYYVWAWFFIRKVRLSESKRVLLPDLELLGPGGKGMNRYHEELQSATDDLVFNREMAPWIIGGFCVVFTCLHPWAALRSVEGRAYDSLIFGLVLFICFLIVLSWARYLYIWNRLRRILRGLERTRLRKAFDRLPKTYSWSPLWYEDAERRAYTISARSVECFQAVSNCQGFSAGSAGQLASMDAAFQRVVETNADVTRRTERSGAVRALQEIFIQAAESLLKERLRDGWVRNGGSDSLAAMAEPLPAEDSPNTDLKCKLLAEEFVALRFVGLIHFESAQLKNLVVLLSAGFILALAAIGSYPFLAGRQCVWSLAGVFVVFGVGIILTFAQMDRDAMLSRLGGTDPGKLDGKFYVRVAAYGALPLLALMASQFPSIGQFLLSWLAPALSALD